MSENAHCYQVVFIKQLPQCKQSTKQTELEQTAYKKYKLPGSTLQFQEVENNAAIISMKIGPLCKQTRANMGCFIHLVSVD